MVLVVLIASDHQLQIRTSLAASVLDLVAAVMMIPLIHLEHIKSIRPSFLASIYLLVTLLFDAVWLRTTWLVLLSKVFVSVLTVSLALKLLILVLESVEKRRLLLEKEKSISIESTSGPFNRGFLVWLNGLLRTGYLTVLSSSTLPTVHEKLSTEPVSERFEDAWSKCKTLNTNIRIIQRVGFNISQAINNTSIHYCWQYSKACAGISSLQWCLDFS
jgi:hypothetical protein